MELSSDQRKFAEQVGELINYIYHCGYSITLGEAFRTHEQAEIYAKEGKGILDSLHCKRLAIDLNLFDKIGNYITDPKEYEQFGKYWEYLDKQNEWGGYFIQRGGKLNDYDHFQRSLAARV